MVIIDQEQENFAKIKLQETWAIVSKNPFKKKDFTISINQVMAADKFFHDHSNDKKNQHAVIKHVKLNHIGRRKMK